MLRCFCQKRQKNKKQNQNKHSVTLSSAHTTKRTTNQHMLKPVSLTRTHTYTRSCSRAEVLKCNFLRTDLHCFKLLHPNLNPISSYPPTPTPVRAIRTPGLDLPDNSWLYLLAQPLIPVAIIWKICCF